MPRLQRLLIATSLTLLLPFIAQAETNNDTNYQAETASIGAMPSRGMTMATVKHYFGKPPHQPLAI